MRQLMTLLAFTVAACATSAQAASHAGGAPVAANPQQTRMGECSAQFAAMRKPSGERQAYMKECLKKETDARTAQNNKMKSCSADFKASNRPGGERAAFMKDCLKK